MSSSQRALKLVEDLNAAWVEGRYDDLHRFFHPDVVMLPPGSGEARVGVEAMVDSYREFGAIGTIHRFETRATRSFAFGGVVMCHLEFEVDYELHSGDGPSGRFVERGTEVYAVDPSASPPVVVWRTQISQNAQ